MEYLKYRIQVLNQELDNLREEIVEQFGPGTTIGRLKPGHPLKKKGCQILDEICQCERELTRQKNYTLN